MFSNLCMCVSPCTYTTSEMTFYFESALEIAQSTFLPSGPRRGRGHMLYKWPPSSSLDWVNEKKRVKRFSPGWFLLFMLGTLSVYSWLESAAHRVQRRRRPRPASEKFDESPDNWQIAVLWPNKIHFSSKRNRNPHTWTLARVSDPRRPWIAYSQMAKKGRRDEK